MKIGEARSVPHGVLRKDRPKRLDGYFQDSGNVTGFPSSAERYAATATSIAL